jgi:hypothetical protein
MTRRSPITGGQLEFLKPGSLRVFQDHPRALPQREAVSGVLLDGGTEGGVADHDEARARDDLLDMRVLPMPSFL